MKSTLSHTVRRHGLLVALTTAAAWAALGPLPVVAQPADMPPPGARHAKDFAERTKKHEAMVQERLAKLEQALALKPEQRSAWDGYASAVKVARLRPAQPPARPDPNADAATRARMHAEHAQAFAQKQAQLADATAKLQNVLSPEQRKTFNELSHPPRPPHGGHFDKRKS